MKADSVRLRLRSIDLGVLEISDLGGEERVYTKLDCDVTIA
jgi:hypothetical protein